MTVREFLQTLPTPLRDDQIEIILRAEGQCELKVLTGNLSHVAACLLFLLMLAHASILAQDSNRREVQTKPVPKIVRVLRIINLSVSAAFHRTVSRSRRGDLPPAECALDVYPATCPKVQEPVRQAP